MEAIRILLIEPDRHARDLLRLLVEAAYEGVIITTARNAEDSREMLQEAHYDIVICDDSPVTPSLKELCDAAGCSLVLMTRDTRLRPSDSQALHHNLPAQSLLYKPMLFRDFCQNLHKAVLVARSRQARGARGRSRRVKPPRKD